MQTAIVLDENNYISGVLQAEDSAPLMRGMIKIDKDKLPKDPVNYKYENGKFIYDPLLEREQLKADAENDTLATILDLQIRLSTLELMIEENSND